MAKVGKQYKKCDRCKGKGRTSTKAFGHTPVYSNCKKCTQGKHREAPKGMLFVDEDDDLQ